MMAQFDQELDPMSTITILDAINWAVSPWDIDLSTVTICNCFKRLFLSLDDSIKNKALHNQGLIKVEKGLQKLEQANNIQQAMDINQFLNPEDEQVHDGLMCIDDAVLSQFSSMEEEEQEDNEHVFPQMLASDALESLYKLQLHEQQQVDANQGLIQLLRHHERGFFCEESKKGSNRLIYDTIFIRLYSTFVENIYVGYKSNVSL